LGQEDFHLILLDLAMPEMNGPQFLKRLAEMNKRIPIIILTGFPDSQLMMDAMKYGPITLMAKPIDHVALISAVRAAIFGVGHEKDSGRKMK